MMALITSKLTPTGGTAATRATRTLRRSRWASSPPFAFRCLSLTSHCPFAFHCISQFVSHCPFADISLPFRISHFTAFRKHLNDLSLASHRTLAGTSLPFHRHSAGLSLASRCLSLAVHCPPRKVRADGDGAVDGPRARPAGSPHGKHRLRNRTAPGSPQKWPGSPRI